MKMRETIQTDFRFDVIIEFSDSVPHMFQDEIKEYI